MPTTFSANEVEFLSGQAVLRTEKGNGRGDRLAIRSCLCKQAFFGDFERSGNVCRSSKLMTGSSRRVL
jgi:hypothetical protein